MLVLLLLLFHFCSDFWLVVVIFSLRLTWTLDSEQLRWGSMSDWQNIEYLLPLPLPLPLLLLLLEGETETSRSASKWLRPRPIRSDKKARALFKRSPVWRPSKPLYYFLPFTLKLSLQIPFSVLRKTTQRFIKFLDSSAESRGSFNLRSLYLIHLILFTAVVFDEIMFWVLSEWTSNHHDSFTSNIQP